MSQTTKWEYQMSKNWLTFEIGFLSHKSTEKEDKISGFKNTLQKIRFHIFKANLSFDLCRTKLIFCSSGSDESAKIPFPFRPNYDPNQIKRTKKF